MELNDFYETIRLLREKNENKKLILFVGSGVSRNVENMPSWKDLIVAMADFSGYSKCDDCKLKRKGCAAKCKIKTDFSPDEYLKIPQYAYNRDSDKYFQIINQCFPSVNVEAPLSQVIFDICPDHIITTNYDSLLESSNSMFRNQYDLIVKDEDLQSAKKSKYIIKMHGDLKDPSTIVLKEADYLDYSQNHILIEPFVKALLTDHILLFLGYSFSDYNIKLIINRVNFLRSQKVEMQSDSIGYLILDKKKISDLETKYFKKNGIEIININQVPLIKDMPSSLRHDEGKRLYSFLSYIKNSSLDTNIDANSHFKYVSELAKNHNVVNLGSLLNLLLIQGYKISSTLTLYNKDQYVQLKEFLNSQAKEAKDLKQLFVNCGIQYITSQDIKNKAEYIILGKRIHNQLFQNPLFILYVENRYIELKEETEKDFTLTNFFYNSLILSPRFTVDTARAFWANINKETLRASEQATYFYNQDLLDLFNFRRGQSLRTFLSNIEAKSLGIIYKPYKDLTDGNHSDLNAIRENLEKLKSNPPA